MVIEIWQLAGAQLNSTLQERKNIMKKIMYYFVFVFSSILLASCATNPVPVVVVVPIEDRSMEKVREINLTKDEIYDSALEWIAQTFVDSKAVIELKDKDNGKIIGKGMTSFTSSNRLASSNIPCRFTLIVEAKDNKYRTTYNNFVGMWGQLSDMPLPLDQNPYIDDVKAKLSLMDDGLYFYLIKSKSNKNW